MPIAFVSEWDGSESKWELWEKGCCMDWELVVNDMWRCEEDVCWVVGISRTCNVLAWSKSKGLFHLVYVVIRKKYWIINTTRFVTWFRLQAIRWFLGPQQWLHIKDGNRTTENGVSPSPIALSLMTSHFLSDANTMLPLSLMDWRGHIRSWRYCLILKEFSQSRRYRRTCASCEIDDSNFSRLLEDSQGIVVVAELAWVKILVGW